MFTNIYLSTINPTANYDILFSKEVFISIIVHTVFYIFIIYGLTYIFKFKIDNCTWKKITYSLIVIMILGYIGRLWRSKSIYNALLKQGVNQMTAIKKTMDIMHIGYFRFYFLG